MIAQRGLADGQNYAARVDTHKAECADVELDVRVHCPNGIRKGEDRPSLGLPNVLETLKGTRKLGISIIELFYIHHRGISGRQQVLCLRIKLTKYSPCTTMYLVLLGLE